MLSLFVVQMNDEYLHQKLFQCAYIEKMFADYSNGHSVLLRHCGFIVQCLSNLFANAGGILFGPLFNKQIALADYFGNAHKFS